MNTQLRAATWTHERERRGDGIEAGHRRCFECYLTDSPQLMTVWVVTVAVQ